MTADPPRRRRAARAAALVAALLFAFLAVASPADAFAAPAVAATLLEPELTSAHSLTATERAAQTVLAAQRARLLRRYAAHPERLFAAPFERVKQRLEGSAVFRSLQQMPKGGLLHIHATATGDAEWIVDRALSDPDCHVFWDETAADYCHGQLAVFPRDDVPAGFVRIADLQRTEPHLRAGWKRWVAWVATR